ncbi:MAG: hypothetical protein Q9P14_01890 [candidate division KSB1 bacterium]|nr:hypothetical protein [candidate division KSB1 bacterium]
MIRWDGDFRPCIAFACKGNRYYCPDWKENSDGRRELAQLEAGLAIGISRDAKHLYGLSTAYDEQNEHHTA